jgi:hypothetical protein
MLLATAAAFVLSTSVGTRPNEYNERWLCDLWAGAQCHATSCLKDAKERCLAVSKPCMDTLRKTRVDATRAERKAACAKALLKQSCGSPKPAECEGLI